MSRKITEVIVARINRFYKIRIERDKVCCYFGDPDMDGGFCNPHGAMPEPTPEIPDPKLCHAHHLCLIVKAEQMGISEASSYYYEDLLAAYRIRLATLAANAPNLPSQPPETAPQSPQAEVELRQIPFRKSSAAWKIWCMLIGRKVSKAILLDELRGENYYYFKKFVPEVLKTAAQLGVLTMSRDMEIVPKSWDELSPMVEMAPVRDGDTFYEIMGDWDTTPGRRIAKK